MRGEKMLAGTENDPITWSILLTRRHIAPSRSGTALSRSNLPPGGVRSRSQKLAELMYKKESDVQVDPLDPYMQSFRQLVVHIRRRCALAQIRLRGHGRSHSSVEPAPGYYPGHAVFQR